MSYAYQQPPVAYGQAPSYSQAPGAYQQPQQAAYGQAQPYGMPQQPAPSQYGRPQSAHGQQPAYQPANGMGAPPVAADQSVALWFRAIDADGSGFLDARELQQALAKGNLHYGLTDTDQMVRAFDTRGSRTLNLQEFQKLHEFLNSVTQSFNFFDQNRSRSLEFNEVIQALKHAGFHMDAPVVQAMFRRHDPNNSNTLTLDEYIRLCLFLQSCVRTFGAFDPQRTGRVAMDFNQFCYAASHIA